MDGFLEDEAWRTPLRGREGFTAGFLGRISSGEATEAELAAAEAAGAIDAGRRRMLAARLIAREQRERDDHDRIALVEARLGANETLDPNDPKHRLTADAYYDRVLRPALDEHDFDTTLKVLPDHIRAR